MATSKKITKVESSSTASKPAFVPTAEAKAQATGFRTKAMLFWAGAFAAQIIAMVVLFKKQPEINLSTVMTILLYLFLVIDLVLLIVGSFQWKKANRYDPASKANGVKFFFQNQLGVVSAVVCFLPVVILAIVKKEYLVAAIAALFMIGGGAASADYNAPSQEEYAEQTAEVEALTGQNFVFWTKSGTKFHLYDDCRYINSSKTTEIFQGTVADARKEKGITELCSACKTKVMKEKGITDEQLQEAQAKAKTALDGAVETAE
ncbi:MAG: hypothetical protein LBN95_10440 [Prevotellaceae bacterium]|jgi:nitrogen fixation/metabolism regulation signal transduction histidine kinase|nr:hypothetical protein [Prevotellaceae bacterium]